MGFVLGWIAVTFTAMAGASPKEAGAAPITYAVRMVETQGMGWREGVMAHLKPVTRQGAATVWTMPQHVMTQLVKEAMKDPVCRLTQAPRVTAFAGVPATIQCRANRELVTRVSWNWDESGPQAAPEKVRLGWHTTFVGRRIDQGVLVKLVFEDTHIRAVHRVKLGASHAPCCSASQSSVAAVSEPHGFEGVVKAGKLVALPPTGTSPFEVPDAKRRCMESDGCCQSAKDDALLRTVAIDVPEIGGQEVAGEWLIPSGEFLLLSFGAYTVADTDGRAIVKERLAIIGAEEVTDPVALSPVPMPPPPGLIPTPATPNATPTMPSASAPPAEFGPTAPAVRFLVPPPLAPTGTTAPLAAPSVKVPLPMPAVPARSLPEGYHTDGSKAALPPLPADEMDGDSDSSDSSEPLASPQTKKSQRPKPTADPSAHKTALPRSKSTLPAPSGISFPNVFEGFQFQVPLKSFSLKLPFNQKLDIEVRGRVSSVRAADRENTADVGEAARWLADEWERYWLLDSPPNVTRYRVDGSVGP
jgi:hypothetical protein